MLQLRDFFLYSRSFFAIIRVTDFLQLESSSNFFDRELVSMNKKLISVAIAAAISAPAAMAGDVTIYGEAHVATSMYDGDMTTNGNTADGWDLSSHESYLGFKGSEDLGNGLKAIWQMELQISMTDMNGNNTDGDVGNIPYRNTFVGIASPWGTLLAGRHDTPMMLSTAGLDIFSETIADYNTNDADDELTGAGNLQGIPTGFSGGLLAGQSLGFVDLQADNAIAYVSPTWNGLTLVGAIVQPGLDMNTTAAANNGDGFSEAYSVAALYSNGPFYATISREVIDEDYVEEILGLTPALQAVVDEDARWRVGLGYTANGLHAGFVYEDQEHALQGVDAQRWQISGSYTFGNNVLKAMYGENDVDFSSQAAANLVGVAVPDGDATAYTITTGYTGWDVQQWAIGLDHNFSKRTTAYVVYTDVDVDQGVAPGQLIDEADWSGLSIGLKHKF